MSKARRPWRSLAILALVGAAAGVLSTAVTAGSPPGAPADSEAKRKGGLTKLADRKPAYLDGMLAEAWSAANIKPSAEAPDAEYLRRVYLDIVGRIPTVQEARAFLDAKDRKDVVGRRAKLVDYLLEGPDYPKNFGNLWSTQLLGRKPQGRRVDRPALSNWLRRQFAENRPWNEIAYDLVTAKGSNKDNGAVNYTLAHLEGDAVPLTSITTRVFLGQQIQCTQCHDHPSNDWKQKDFWSINAFFKGIRAEEMTRTDATGAEVYDYTDLQDEPTEDYAVYDKRNAYREIAYPTYLDGRKISQGRDVDRREALGKFITEPANDQFARAFVNRLWGHFMGRGFVHPIDDFGAHNPPSHPELLDKLAADFKASGYDIKALIRSITASKAYNLSSLTTKDNEKDETLFSHMALKPMTPEQLFDSLLTATEAHKAAGPDIDKTRDAWLRQFVVTFANDEEGETSNFQGTIPQALMLMNGELMAKATGGKSGSYLGKLLDRSRAQNQFKWDNYIINHLYLSALSRYPSNSEMATARTLLSSSPDTIYLVEDLFWVLLNSNEFVLNR